ncbi:GTPase Era [bacterium]|jgi:GTP-binding protein Era|nr:GTPase Era [bacterium]NBW57087.1 GTPase Era [bacterium]NBX71441.1 GTPase Era [bacterium]
MLEKVCGYVAIVGKPNVGKSTLLNTLMKRKLTITSKKPQTTRHTITCVLTDERWQLQMLLVDTPGINFNSQHHIMKWMHQQAVAALKQLDLRFWVLEAGHWEEHDQIIASMLQPLATSTIVLLNKIDKIKDKSILLKQMTQLAALGFNHIVPLSALRDQAVDIIMKEARPLLPKQDFYYPAEQQVTCTKEFMSSEVIREKLMRYLGQEIPYECSVHIDHLTITDNKLHRIAATIYTANDRHKKVIIGTDGRQLKMIGQAARLTLERMFDQKVFLQLWVKVKESWAAHQEVTNHLGLA